MDSNSAPDLNAGKEIYSISNNDLSSDSGHSRRSSAGKKKHSKDGSFENFDLMNSPCYNDELLDMIIAGIAQNIQIEVDRQNISIGYLADKSGVTSAQISRILNCNASIGMRSFIKISYALEVSPRDLFPFDINRRKTNGERFDDITKSLSVESVNFLLDLSAQLAKMKKLNRF